jgi:hypothetical protein
MSFLGNTTWTQRLSGKSVAQYYKPFWTQNPQTRPPRLSVLMLAMAGRLHRLRRNREKEFFDRINRINRIFLNLD